LIYCCFFLPSPSNALIYTQKKNDFFFHNTQKKVVSRVFFLIFGCICCVFSHRFRRENELKVENSPRAVIASVAKQSVTINASWVTDCFVAALLAMTGKGYHLCAKFNLCATFKMQH
jgi:hypothetical protein